jgi:hypothetical protein
MNDVTEFRAPTGMDMNSIASQGYGMVQYGPTDDKLIVGFYKKSVLNAAKSREMGVPLHESRDFVKIQHPGETLNVVDRPVLDDDKRRWPRQWANYQQGVNQVPDGIPLSLLFPDKPHIVTMMRGYNIHTVEQLSNLSAEAIGTVGMGAQDWVNAAQRYMERADKGVNHHQFEKALSDKDAEIRALRRQVEEVTALVRQQQSQAAPPNPGHPFDAQSAQINAVHQSANDPFTAAPAQFVQDLSGQVQPTRRGPGRPRKTQEH